MEVCIHRRLPGDGCLFEEVAAAVTHAFERRRRGWRQRWRGLRIYFFLGATFFLGAAFLGAAFLGAAFLGAAFLAAGLGRAEEEECVSGRSRFAVCLTADRRMVLAQCFEGGGGRQSLNRALDGEMRVVARVICG